MARAMRKLIVVGLVLLSGCKIKTDGAAPSGATTTQSAAVTQRAAVVDMLALVKAKAPPNGPIAGFELAHVAPAPENGNTGTQTFVKPAGWTSEPGSLTGTLRPPKGVDLGWRTSLTVGWDCDGVCAPKDWAKLIDAKLKRSIEDSPTTHDETLPDGRRVRWKTGEKQASFIAAWFEPGASHYDSCSGVLDDKSVTPYIAAFVEI